MGPEEAELVNASDGVRERPIKGATGPRMVPVGLVGLIVGAALLRWVIFQQVHGTGPPALRVGISVVAVLSAVLGIQLLRGLTSVAPGDAVVVQIFGRYTGTIRGPGLRWVNPLARRQPISLRIRSYETAVTKINDADGNPIEISLVVVWQVMDTARALYEVDDFARFFALQCEAALGYVVSQYRYDNYGDGGPSLCSNAPEVLDQLTSQIMVRVESAGIKVIDTGIVRLAYAPEIAQVMLRRQQAGAIVAARHQIVEGAVGMVELALNRLEEENVVDLDEERKAAMVSNLLVVLCSDHPTQPIVNAGTLYH